jgi:hypothetical protein
LMRGVLMRVFDEGVLFRVLCSGCFDEGF